MRSSRSWLVGLLVLGLMSLTPAVGASPPEYEAIDLGSIGSGPYYMSVATGINARGQIVGQSAESIAAEVHLILWEKDALMVDLGFAPDGGHINTAAINNRGQLVGTIVEGQVLGREYHPQHGLRAFVWRGGEFIYLEDAPDRPAAINDRGQVVGQRTDEAGRSVPVLWTNGVVVEIETPGESAYVSDVNNRGQVVGSYVIGVRSHAFRWQDGFTTDLLTPSGAVWSAAANAINDPIVSSTGSMNATVRGVMTSPTRIPSAGRASPIRS